MPSKPRILIADDDLESLSILYLKLLHRQIKTEAVTNTGEVMHQIKQFKPHILVISTSLIDGDINLFCKRMKAQLRIIPVLMKEKSEEDYFLFDVLEKPVEIEQLMEVINLYR
jgi:DNA-binding response OmpR family regulator